VELNLNGKSLGTVDHPKDGYVFAFPDVVFAAGTIEAKGYKSGSAVVSDKIETAGPAQAIKLTPITGPGGLKADGADVALFDVEVVDAQGRRCPTDEARIDFAVSGPGVWRGGYNSGIVNSTNNLYLNTECGINRVSIRATRTPGEIHLSASRSGLEPAGVVVASHPITVTAGLAE
jgi:beta-galactosidase